MTGAQAPTIFFCLATGCALGMLFLLLKALRLGLSAGKILTAVLDVLFGIICGAVVFLAALAVDKGRLRLLQAVLQMAGAWAAITAFDPAVCALGRAFSWIKRKFFRGNPKKT